MKKILIYPLLVLIKLYQNFISPLLPSTCRYSPTCSEYTKQSLVKFGLIKGSIVSIKRIIKCKLRALPTEISGGIATSLVFSAWNASIYVNQMDDDKVMKVEKTKNYEKIVQNIVAKNKGLKNNFNLGLHKRPFTSCTR